MSNAWAEHEQEDGAHEPHLLADDDAGLLEPAFDDVPVEGARANRQAAKRGLNPRLLAVLLAVAVVGGAGFMFMRMKNQNAARAAAIAEQAVSASTEPTHGLSPGAVTQPTSVGLLGGGGAPGAGPVPDASGASMLAAAPAGPAALPAGIPAGAAPVGVPPVPDPQVAALQQQISSMGNDMSKVLEENNRLQGELARAKQAHPKANSAPTQPVIDANAAPEQKAAKPVHARKVNVAAAHRGMSGHKGRGKNAAKDDIITEARDSRLTGMSVRAIYPLNGRDARAWINVDGDVVEVSAGSTVAGAYVKRINPDTMEVVTDAGVIRAKP